MAARGAIRAATEIISPSPQPLAFSGSAFDVSDRKIVGGWPKDTRSAAEAANMLEAE